MMLELTALTVCHFLVCMLCEVVEARERKEGKWKSKTHKHLY